MKKQKNKDIGVIIFWIIVPLVLIACCAVNIVFACKSGQSANIYTAIGGWVGFLATAGVGAITVFQNKRYEQKSYMQYHIDKLCNAKELIYMNYKNLCVNNKILRIVARYYNTKYSSFKREEYINSVYEYRVMILDLGDLCQAQENDLYNLRYNFDKAVEIYRKLAELNKILYEMLNANSNEFENQELDRKSAQLYCDIRNGYNQLILDMDNKIEALLNYVKFKKFKKEIDEIKDIDKKTKEIVKITELYKDKEETQNGQAEDDVDGQGK